MLSKPPILPCAVVLAVHVAVLATPGCREYTCNDLANCPSEGADASSPVKVISPNATATVPTAAEPSDTQSGSLPTSSEMGGKTSSGEVNQSSGDVNQSSSDVNQSSSEVSSEGAMSSEEPRTSDEPGCPNAPGGICECSPGEIQKCSSSGAKGACADGNQTCTEDGVFGPCDVVPADKDDCSVKGNDADCDGTPNTGCPCVDGETQPCGSDTDVGQCKLGVSTCVNSVFGECVGAVARAPRRCDSTQDYDCDGLPDNSLDDTCKCDPDGAPRQCNAHPGFDGVGPCRAGTQSCELSADGTRSAWGACTGDVAPAPSDSCVEGDNSDCVGGPNTNCTCIAGRMETCGARYGYQGICAGVTLTCQANGTWPGSATCMSTAKQEICNNNLDDNCDGTVNDAASCPCSAVPSPCVHGTCNVGSGSAYTCDCTGTGYEGTHCDKPIALTVAGPQGATSCHVYGVSNDGTVVAADCEIGEPMRRTHFWINNKWVKAAIPAGYTVAYLGMLSADGTKAVGTLRNSNGTNYGARWSNLNGTATLLNTPEWKDVVAMSPNGNSISALDPGGNVFIWTGGGGSAPTIYVPNSGATAIFSGDASKAFIGDSQGFRIWTSSTSSTLYTLASGLLPVAASNDGTAMVGWFYSGSPSGIYKYSSTGNSSLNSTANCRPSSMSSDGRYVLGTCPDGLYRWADASRSTVQSLIASTGSTVTIRTDVEARMSYNAKYVALPSSGNGIVVVHLPSP